MRHINLLEPSKVPRDDEFKFRDRAKALVDKWHEILNANKGGDGKDKDKTGDGEAGVTEGTANLTLGGEGDLTMMDE